MVTTLPLEGERGGGLGVASLYAQSIKPGQTWNDASGSAINAHGGCVVYSNGNYYWFGEHRNGNKSDGISCYRSSDLYSWTKLNRAVTPTGTMTDENRDIASGRTLERPKVIYNTATGKWVMWIHWENGSDYGQAKCAVCIADKVEGPYSLVDVFRPNGRDSRDQTLFLDTDGTAYHVYSTNMNSNTHCERLTADFLQPEPDYAVQLKGRRFEAAALFKVGDIYYGLFSGCTGWDPNPGRYMWTYDLMDETWNAPADFKASDGSTGINFCIDNGKNNSYQSQSNFVFPVPGKDKCFIYMGDRWNSSNVQSSKHVWLPLSVRSGYPTVCWHDSWSLSVFDDMYRMKRMKTIEEGSEGYLLEKYSNRIVSRPKSSLTLEDDGESNLALIFHKTAKPYTYKIEDKATGKYLESVYGTTRWQVVSEATSQEWVFWLEEDGYFRIENAADGVCLSVSGNSTEAGTTLYMNAASKDIHQSFSPYFDSVAHAEYEEADMWSRDYLLANREEMKRQQEVVGVQGVYFDGKTVEHQPRVFDLSGRLIRGVPLSGCYILHGRKVVVK
ncbi:MAG: family 43 glycosylhydrolase [Bacteroidaceae bacterium]|nr:family 43 glycosylhydrolase [Bacteroidaceae bacterium]